MKLDLVIEALRACMQMGMKHPGTLVTISASVNYVGQCDVAIKILEQAQANGGQLPPAAPPVSTLVGKREKWV